MQTQPQIRPFARQFDARAINAAHGLAARCATYSQLRRLTPFPEPSRLRLRARIGRRLTPTEETAYGLLRRAARMGRPGVRLTVAEIGQLCERDERSVRRALDGLGPHRPSCPESCREHVDLVRRVRQFSSEPRAWHGQIYHRWQLPSAYILGPRAKSPGKVRSRDHHFGIGGQNVPPTTPPLREEIGALRATDTQTRPDLPVSAVADGRSSPLPAVATTAERERPPEAMEPSVADRKGEQEQSPPWRKSERLERERQAWTEKHDRAALDLEKAMAAAMAALETKLSGGVQ